MFAPQPSDKSLGYFRVLRISVPQILQIFKIPQNGSLTIREPTPTGQAQRFYWAKPYLWNAVADLPAAAATTVSAPFAQ